MSTVFKSIGVDVPPATAFREWTRFEELPRFMRGVAEVRRLDDRHLFWRGQILGIETTWELEITEVVPDRRIAWRSTAGPKNHGAIILEPLPPSATRVGMEVHYDPVNFVQYVGDYLGVLGRWVERSLSRFKEVMEQPPWTLSQLPLVDEIVGQ